MTDKTIRWIYGGVFAAALLVFGFVLFPEDKVRDHLLISWGEIFPGTGLDFHSLSPALPPGLDLERVEVRFAENLVLEIPSVSLACNMLSSLGAMRSYSFDADGYDGKARGTVTLAKDLPGKVTADIRLSDIRLEKIALVETITRNLFSGRLSGEIIHDSAKVKDPTFFKATLSGCKIPLKLKELDLGVVEFSEVVIDAALTGQNLQIRKCVLEGDQAQGEFSGRISFDNVVNRSRLNLTGAINLNHEFLKTLAGIQIPANLMVRNVMRFAVGGTFEEPILSFR
jgi:type II secretion system protein N